MTEILFYIIISILVIDFLVERLLAYLNLKHRQEEIPKELEGIYNPDEYKKQQKYKFTNAKLSLIVSIVSFIPLLLMLVFKGFAWVDELARSISGHPILIALAFFGILALAMDILLIPFEVYGTFVIEEKFGFNKTTPKIFVLDKLKQLMLGAIIGGGLLSIIVWLYQTTGEWFWILAWAFISAFSIFMSIFYTSLIVPLFNKLSPLEDGELRREIQNFADNAGFKLKDIFLIDGSKRSTKANAYFTGLGPKKKIVLYDTLINDLEIDEVVSVLAHEIGHYKKKHIIFSLVTGLLLNLFIFYIFSLIVSSPILSEALGAKQHSFHLALITFGIIYSPISFVIGLWLNHRSRKHEYQADSFAREYSLDQKLMSALKNLTAKNLIDLTPHPAYVFVYYSHPTLLQRIQNLARNV